MPILFAHSAHIDMGAWGGGFVRPNTIPVQKTEARLARDPGRVEYPTHQRGPISPRFDFGLGLLDRPYFLLGRLVLASPSTDFFFHLGRLDLTGHCLCSMPYNPST